MATNELDAPLPHELIRRIRANLTREDTANEETDRAVEAAKQKRDAKIGELRIERGRLLTQLKATCSSKVGFAGVLTREKLGSVSDAYKCMALAEAADPQAAAQAEREQGAAQKRKSRQSQPAASSETSTGNVIALRSPEEPPFAEQTAEAVAPLAQAARVEGNTPFDHIKRMISELTESERADLYEWLTNLITEPTTDPEEAEAVAAE